MTRLDPGAEAAVRAALGLKPGDLDPAGGPAAAVVNAAADATRLDGGA